MYFPGSAVFIPFIKWDFMKGFKINGLSLILWQFWNYVSTCSSFYALNQFRETFLQCTLIKLVRNSHFWMFCLIKSSNTRLLLQSTKNTLTQHLISFMCPVRQNVSSLLKLHMSNALGLILGYILSVPIIAIVLRHFKNQFYFYDYDFLS